MTRPRIAVLLDENTSGGGTKYEAAKGYFRSVADAGGLPFGIPYLPEIVDLVVRDYDGLVAVGGRFAYPDEWYLPGEVSPSPPSERLPIERALVEGFLAWDKPVLGICAGMQMLACLHGCRLAPDLRALVPHALEHDRRDHLHPITLAEGSRLRAVIGRPRMEVNSFHREAVARLSPQVVASARTDDGIVEAIEIPAARFAIGIQWHQELMAGTDHPGNALFRAFVEAA
ncbi:gamma-glutamyl-gamma-aminobutyrate hydrolase family protein [Salinarimonas soli]|uniref:Gamma-glutamyl-gamma-aminobutyrate hydrolase family protein n=1 Tax=Salinarimonas soli TaxID=1638099 RepID=A0A5B2VIB8_9HYPH|nr:gamma-glutamyl-gamma-aminobutyrate hydrolase family protein [Salinarimonas soli]KAA2237927.1 gamma-glutamyl-gamma-aminobutyrate hydrolase family protein [Salinarimonas soli]